MRDLQYSFVMQYSILAVYEVRSPSPLLAPGVHTAALPVNAALVANQRQHRARTISPLAPTHQR